MAAGVLVIAAAATAAALTSETTAPSDRVGEGSICTNGRQRSSGAGAIVFHAPRRCAPAG